MAPRSLHCDADPDTITRDVDTSSWSFLIVAVVGTLGPARAGPRHNGTFGGYIGGTHTEKRDRLDSRGRCCARFPRRAFLLAVDSTPAATTGCGSGGSRGRIAGWVFEVEMIHMKAIADTTGNYTVTRGGNIYAGLRRLPDEPRRRRVPDDARTQPRLFSTSWCAGRSAEVAPDRWP